MRLCALALGCALMAGVPAGALNVDDPVFTQGLQWGLDRINAPAAWTKGTGKGVTIAIVDSGADLEHEDLRTKIIGQVSCVGSNGDPTKCTGSAKDDNGHGTHVAAIAAAATGNGRGMAGVAPDAQLLIVRSLVNDCSTPPCTASGTPADVAAGIRWAVDHGANVINLSLGGGGLTSAVQCDMCDAIDYAWSKGVIAVVAAGNDDTDLPPELANKPAVIVTATTRGDTKASYSNRNSSFLQSARWPVAAPGGEAETDPRDCATGGVPKGVVSAYWSAGRTDQYACLAGTSMAAPHVAGALALLLGLGRTPQSAVDRLLATAKDLGPPGRDDTFGFGLIDLDKAVAGATTTPPTTAGSPTSTSSTLTTRAAQPDSGATTVPTASPTDTSTPESGEGPVITTPETSPAAPFEPEPHDATLPGWLVGTAIAAIMISGLGTALASSRLLWVSRSR